MKRLACIVLLALSLILVGCDKPEDNRHPFGCYIDSWTGETICD